MTLKCSPPTSSRALPKLAFSVLLAWVASFASADYTELSRQARRTDDPKALARLVVQSKLAQNVRPVDQALSRLRSARTAGERVRAVEQMRGVLDLYAMNEAGSVVGDPGKLAREIKSSALYRDPGLSESSNWLGKALERLANLLRQRQRRAPNLNIGGFGQIVTYLMWGLLISAVAVFLFLALRHYNWRAKLSRKAAAVMEDDEPERTADEWLTEADRLEASGDFRRAVRCLYLACLLRFDEAKVARFDRGQTNWEHLHRIQASPRLPDELDFEAATKAFDRVWYGKIVRGHEDVDLFRTYYLEVKTRLGAVSA